MAVGDAYGAKEWRRLGTTRSPRTGERSSAAYLPRGRGILVPPGRAHVERKVFGGPKYTVSPIYEGMLKEEMDAAAERHLEVRTSRS